MFFDRKVKSKPRWLMLAGGVASIIDGCICLLTFGEFEGMLRIYIAEYTFKRSVSHYREHNPL